MNMNYYELKNTATCELAQVIASNMKEAAIKAGWPVRLTKCIYRAPATYQKT
jgi:acyl-CoA thioesterase FadM